MFSCSLRIITTQIVFVMQVKISFHPLYKFEVILVFRFGKFLNVDVFENFAFGKSELQNFKIADELPLIYCVETDSLKGDFSRVHDIQDLAINGTGSELLYFGEVDLEQLVDPGEKLSFGDEECTFHDANTLTLLVHTSKILQISQIYLINDYLCLEFYRNDFY